MALTRVHRSQRDDFNAMLQRLGRPEEFEATDCPAGMPVATIRVGTETPAGPIINRVKVRSLRTGVERWYRAGSSITNNGAPGWVNEIERDIVAGEFDKPD